MDVPITTTQGETALTATAPPLLEMAGITKRFGEKVALERIDLAVAAGEVHAICGENGAGKSTLMNILSGIHQPDSGRITLRGDAVEFPNAAAATRLGIGMVHQHFTLVPSMTVAENIYLGRQPRRWGILTDKKAMMRSAEELVARYGFHLDPRARVGDLTVGQRQRAEIVKALAFDAEVLILDEPTAVLTPPEVDDLIEIVGSLRDRGRTVLFITHKLREVKALSDRVTVIRRGRSVGTHLNSEITTEGIAEEMVGRSVFLTEKRSPVAGPGGAAPVLAVRDLSHITPSGRQALQGISFDLHPGEILGIAGVEGNGQTELAEVLTGLRRASGGSFTLAGTEATAWPAADLRTHGLAHIPEDRLDRGLSKEMSVAENLAVSNYRGKGLLRRGLVSRQALEDWAQECITTFDIRGAKPSTAVGQLSGGNMQKVVVARELAREPKVLVVAQPTRGVDIGASEFVHHQILAAAAQGCAVLLISSELTEIFALSDRIGVMFEGALVDIVDRQEATEQQIGLLMNTGSTEVAA
jgi:simple sugar transport system ATP-binding protein